MNTTNLETEAWELKRLAEQTSDLDIEGRDEVLAAKHTRPAPTSSELLVAALLARSGLRVRMLLDQDRTVLSRREARNGGSSLPDLRVWHESLELEFLVEVRRISSGTVAFGSLMSHGLFKAGLPYRVHAEPLGAAVSTPGTDYHSRERQEKLANRLVQLVVRELGRADVARHPSGAFSIQMPTSKRHPTQAANFHRFRCVRIEEKVSEREAKSGILSGSGSTDIRSLGGSEFRQFVLKAILEKASQQSKFPASIAGLPYVVAIDSHEFDIDPVGISSQLVQGLCYEGNGICQRGWPRGTLEPLRKTPWSVLESAWRIQESEMVRNVHRDGRTVTEPVPHPQFMAPCFAKLSGVLALHRTRDVVQLIPNPWAKNGYNEPRLMELGFSDSPEGGPMPRRAL